MKTRNLLLILLLSYCAMTVFAQTSIGIPVQGIARDDNGTARINTAITITFDLYYVENGNETPLYSPAQVENLTTDSFGVFSTIVNTAGRRALFSSREIFLRISDGGTIISDELLNSVPYAIAADNGVPTGAIMPFIGTSSQVPDGWLLCDGSAIPSGLEYEALINLIGNDTPNLQGTFLRGTGTSPTNSQTGPALGTFQGDLNKVHSHGIDQNTQNDGSHSHTTLDNFLGIDSGHSIGNGVTAVPENSFLNSVTKTTSSTAHTHRLVGNTQNTGGNETRPVNYGVNYIIKL